MKIALHDSDNTRFPNLALMKLSAWHKAQGDNVVWWSALFSKYDRLYSSKVFTHTLRNPYLPPDATCGGTGYDIESELPDYIEHICPDYDLYGLDYSVGFLTRGCPRRCKWCIVPEKEGHIRKHADIDEFLQHKRAILLDNNVLAHEWGIAQIEKIAGLGVRVDFNQGLDARLVDEAMARLLARVKFDPCIRFACDSQAQKKPLERAVFNLRAAGCKRPIMAYLLVQDDIEDAHDRAEFLRGLGVDPFAQPFIDPHGTMPPTKIQRQFARWVNHKAIFKSVAWADYQ